MKADEAEFLRIVYSRDVRCAAMRQLIADRDHLGNMASKRAWYILGKWSRLEWYNYDVTLDLGWLEDKGKEAAENIP